MEKLEKSGIDVGPAMNILEKSRNELSNMDFKEAHNSSSFAEETGIELEITEEQFLKVHSGLEKLKDSGVDVGPAMKILEEGKNELSNMNCSNSDIVLETLDIGPTRMELFSANKNARNSSALAEEKGIELKEQYGQTLRKIDDLKEKIKHLSDRKIKADDLKKLLKTMKKATENVD